MQKHGLTPEARDHLLSRSHDTALPQPLCTKTPSAQYSWHEPGSGAACVKKQLLSRGGRVIHMLLDARYLHACCSTQNIFHAHGSCTASCFRFTGPRKFKFKRTKTTDVDVFTTWFEACTIIQPCAATRSSSQWRRVMALLLKSSCRCNVFMDTALG